MAEAVSTIGKRQQECWSCTPAESATRIAQRFSVLLHQETARAVMRRLARHEEEEGGGWGGGEGRGDVCGDF